MTNTNKADKQPPITICRSVVNKLKVCYYENWNPEDYGYMFLELHTGHIGFSNNLDCDGSVYFCYKSFLKNIKKWESHD